MSLYSRQRMIEPAAITAAHRPRCAIRAVEETTVDDRDQKLTQSIGAIVDASAKRYE
jgi:hypothetical protein